VTADPELRVVYVEDDDRLARLTTQYLTSHRVEVHVVTRGDRAVAEVLRVRPDVVLLDLMLPGADGLDVCRQLRARTDVPIIMVTARTKEADRVLGLEGGADDYVAKPFQMEEVLARIRALIRRAAGHATAELEALGVRVDTRSGRVTRDGALVKLTAQEYRLLSYLMHHRGKIVSRIELIEHIYEQDFDRESNTIEVFIGRLRRKLGDNLIETVRGLGYRIPGPDEQ